MFGIDTKFESYAPKVTKAVDDANFRNFGHALATIRKDATSTIEKAPDGVPSAAGTPPHTHTRRFLGRAIRFDANKQGGIAGPIFSLVGLAGEINEKGLENHPVRAFMRPALERNISRFRAEWNGSVHE